MFNKLARICAALTLLIPLPVLADHVPTQEPYGYNESVNTETGHHEVKNKPQDSIANVELSSPV